MFGFFDSGSDGTTGSTGDLPPVHGEGNASLGTLLKLLSFLLVLGAIAFLVAGWNSQPSTTAETCIWLGKRIGVASIGVFLAALVADRYF